MLFKFPSLLFQSFISFMMISRQLSLCHRQMLSRHRRLRIMMLSSKSAVSPGKTKVEKNIWLSPVGLLKGVGPKTQDALKQLDMNTIADVLFHFPTAIIDRRKRSLLSGAKVGDLITVELCVKNAEKGFNGRPHSITCEDAEGTTLEVKYFYAVGTVYNQWTEISRDFKVESSIILSGKLGCNKYGNHLEIVNPDIVMSALEPIEVINEKFGLEPIYGLTKGLKNSKLRSIIQASLMKLSENEDGDEITSKSTIKPIGEEWMTLEERNKRNWPSFVEALSMIHNPKEEADILPNSDARKRLAFDDFVSQFLHQMIKQQQLEKEYDAKFQHRRTLKGFREESSAKNGNYENSPIVDNHSIVGSGLYTKIFENNLTFNLTDCQRNAVKEITEEIAEDRRMSRLLQGDVGSGKTLVAVLSVLNVIESNKQGALVAPTGLLAAQHFKVITDYFNRISDSFPHLRECSNEIYYDSINRVVNGTITDTGHANHNNNINNTPKRRLRVELINGNVKGKARERILQDTKDGLIDLLIGTHALLNEDIIDCFPSLGLVVIDEDHKFGVAQREVISSRTNSIFMTATPIPRSLYILSENENTISTLIQKPPLRRTVSTLARPDKTVDTIIERISSHIPFGTKVFWVSPTLLASESAPTGYSVMERYEQLSNIFPGKVGLLHGKMTPEEKDAVMSKFSEVGSDLSILVSTTVIEVGVDVPDSSICIIDRAEQFGLSQLHQIRGRIGRGEKPAQEKLTDCFCVLLYDDTPDEPNLSDLDLDSAIPPLTPKPVPLKLQILVDTSDGFEIAEKDLMMRGPGDYFGNQQSGLRFTGLRAGNFVEHTDLLKEAHTTATAIFKKEINNYCNDENEIQNLLSLFTPPSNSPTPSPLNPSKTVKSKTLNTVSENTMTNTNSVSSSQFVDFTVLDGVSEPAIVVIDLETTGLSPSKAFIIQFAAKILENNEKKGYTEKKSFNRYVKLETEKVPAFITALTGITQRTLDTEGKPFNVVWGNFIEWLKEISESEIPGESRPIVFMAHNLRSFDLPFLDAEIRRNIVRGEDWISDNNIVSFVDSLEILKEKEIWNERMKTLNLPSTTVSKPVKHKLGIIYHFVFNKSIENAHNAMGDVDALSNILGSEGIKENWRKYANKLQFRSFTKAIL